MKIIAHLFSSLAVLHCSTLAAKRLLASGLLAAGISNYALGDTYYGAMICTVTDSSDPSLFVGSIFQNSYQYDSLSVNGLFYSSYFRELTTGAPSDLSGWIHEAQSDWSSGPQYVLADIGIAAGAGNSVMNHITIANGEVTDFYYTNQYGGGNTWYSGNSFSFYSSNSTGRYTVGGTIAFTAPVARVSETGTTFAMFGGAIVGLVLLRRRFVS